MNPLTAAAARWFTSRDATRCGECGNPTYCAETRMCLACEDRSRAMRRAERANPWPGYQERLTTKVGAVWHVADRWRDLEQGGRP